MLLNQNENEVCCGRHQKFVAMDHVFKVHQPQVVFHAAATSMFLDGRKSIASHFNNIQGTKNIADLSCHYKVKKFVMVSTDKAVNPSNVMGASKRIAEKYVQSLHLISSK
jgi:FlaA1/EpsC-like NDP-sugar epimerase